MSKENQKEQFLTDWQKQYVKTHVHRNQPFDAYKFFQDYIDFILDPDDSVDVYQYEIEDSQANIVSFLKSIGITIPEQKLSVKLSYLLDGYKPYQPFRRDDQACDGKWIMEAVDDFYTAYNCASTDFSHWKQYVDKNISQNNLKKIQEQLDQMGLTYEQFYDIFVNDSDDDEYDDAKEKIDVDEVKLAIEFAYEDAEVDSARSNFLYDLEEQVRDALKKCGCSVNDYQYYDEDIELTITVDDFELLYNDIIDDYSSFYEKMYSYNLPELIQISFQNNFKLREPDYGWWDINTDDFYYFLKDRLSDAL